MCDELNFSDLETTEDLDLNNGSDTRETFPCVACNGTGTWTGGYVNRVSGKCHTCNGKGFFLTSPEQRRKAKQSAAKNKAAKVDAYREEHKDLVAYLEDVQSWNGFAQSLLSSLSKYGKLSEGQQNAAYRAMAKHETKQAERKAEQAKRVENATVLDLTRINEMFASASEHLKRPKLRVGNIQIYPAPVSGKNAGCLYVKADGEYAGKITDAGKFLATRSAPDNLDSELVAIAADPIGKISEHGRVTGQCGCCGRELTNKDSIDRGIGPICAGRFGLL